MEVEVEVEVEDDDEQFWLDCWRRGEFKWMLVEVESGPPLLDEVCSIVLFVVFVCVSFFFLVWRFKVEQEIQNVTKGEPGKIKKANGHTH